MNPLATVFNGIAKILSKIKLKCHSSCCQCDCDSISSEEYADIIKAAYALSLHNYHEPGQLPRVTLI